MNDWSRHIGYCKWYTSNSMQIRSDSRQLYLQIYSTQPDLLHIYYDSVGSFCSIEF